MAMIYFVLFPDNPNTAFLYVGLAVHGASAGLNIISLHRKALDSIDSTQSGAAAGIYSMTRFGGSMIATTLIGVVLQWGQEAEFSVARTYQSAFLLLVVFGVLGLLSSFALQKNQK